MRQCSNLACALVLWFVGAGLPGCARCDGSTQDPTRDAQVRATIPEGGTERPSTLVFAATPSFSATEVRSRYWPLASYISEEIGIPVEWRSLKNYDDMHRAITNYEVHLAVMSPLNYVRGKQEMPSLILLAVPVVAGMTTYSGYILSRKDSGVNTMADLEGKRFGFVEELSASGHLYPVAFFHAQGIETTAYFGATQFLGDHDNLVKALVDGTIDAGATFGVALSKPEGRELKIIAKTGRIPLSAWCASPRLDQEIVDDVRSALESLSTRNEEGRRVLSHTEINGFRVVGDDHYDEVRRVVRVLYPDGLPK